MKRVVWKKVVWKKDVWKREPPASAMAAATRRPAPFRGALRATICAVCWMGCAVAAEPLPDAVCADDVCGATAPPAYTGAPLTLRLQGVPVRGVLQQIADFAGLNLVAGDDVAGDMTLRLADVPWDEALDIVLATNGLGKRRTGNVLLVAPAETLAERDRLDAETRRTLAALAPLQTRFVRVRYADAGALAALVGDSALALSERGRALVDERTNSLILTDTADNLEAVERMIGRLDIPVRQVQIEARIVNANSNFSEQMGIRWGVQLLSNGNAQGEDAAQAADATRHSAGAAVADGAAVVSARVSSPALWLDVELSASVDAGEAEIVARPKVVTTDKQPATIETGVEIPYQQATKSGATSIAFKDAVLQLLVTPRITPNGRIVMDLEVKQDTVGRIYHGVPSINTTRIVTQVLVDDGATLVLGGIFQTDRHHAVTRTPLLGNLPFIGRAFRRTTERDDKQELFIFITPAIVADTGSAAPSAEPASGAASSDIEEAA